ncbi:MAG: hypothetical protein FWG77_03125 [Treponema sp.]|nr:hypothetical protein [Treponema sp.]
MYYAQFQNVNEELFRFNTRVYCDPSLNQARIRIKEFLPNHPRDLSEDNDFNFVFYSWGGSDGLLNIFKERFIDNICTDNHIWFNKDENIFCTKNQPGINDFPKHIQGLNHDYITPYLADILRIIFRN